MRTQRKILFLTLCTLFILCVLCGLVFSDLQWPLKEKTYLAGSFGEFRKNHIHAGIDISTHGKIGLPVYAGESGMLYRIKTQVLGFGKAVYIKLKDGKFLVYAHLDRFSPVIEMLVREAQQEEERYQVDIYPKKRIPINKGDLIGYTGDTGGVSPHLHFELRDPDEKPLNPLSASRPPGVDNTPPIITGLAICDPANTYCISYYPAQKIPPEIIISGKKGLAISLYDPTNGNKIGVYELSLIIDEKQFFTVKFDTFSYDEFNDNFIMCNKDLYVNHNKIYYHLFRAFNNKLPFYSTNSNGILILTPGKHSIELVTIDNAGNKSAIKFNIVYKTATSPEKPKLETISCSSKDNLCHITIDKEDLYYPTEVSIDSIPNKRFGELIPVSNIYVVKPKKAVFKKAKISIDVPQYPSGHIYKYEDGRWKYMDKDTVTDFTRFALFKDTTPPDIRIISTYPVFRAKIEDNGSGPDYDKISLYIDGEKVIAEYSINRKELFYAMPKGKHRIICTASDKAGNESKKEQCYR